MNKEWKKWVKIIVLILGIIGLLVIIIYSIIKASKSSQDLDLFQKKVIQQIESNQQTPTPTTLEPTPPPTTPAPTTLAPTVAPVEETIDPNVTIVPDISQLSSFCGPNTTPGSGDYQNQCVLRLENGSDSLGEIVEELKQKNKILPVGDSLNLQVIDRPTANLPKQNLKPPQWFTVWQDKGGYDANKTISGSSYGVTCTCGDCAAWRGGNAGTCVGANRTGREKTMDRRVACDINYDPDRCVCAYPFVPVGGLCVTPFKYDPQGDEILRRPCCPSCVYEGTCVGEEECRGECQENIVEYPGIKYICTNLPEEQNNAYRISQSDFENNCTLDTNSGHGMNEYECAYYCDDDPINCSRKCLPKLWKWNELYVEDQLMGYIQTDDLIQFQPEDVELRYCPIGDETCKQVDITQENDTPNCKDCTNCSWELNPILNEYVYNCENCGICEFRKPTGVDENGFRTFETTTCKNVTQCKGCNETIDPLRSKRSIVQCNYCKSQSNCLENLTNQRNPNLDSPNLETYNKGQNYNPETINLWSDTNRFGDVATGFFCSSTGLTSNCKATLVDGNDPKLGYLDGGTPGYNNQDCTKRGSCSVSVPRGAIVPDNPKCYGAKYYDQLPNNECQKLPLPVSNLELSQEDVIDTVEYGVAKGIPKKECKDVFCRTWDWRNSVWSSNMSNLECDALCEPDLYKNFQNIPEFANTNEQVDFLMNGGGNELCFSGRFSNEISGGCEGIDVLPQPPPDARPRVCDTTAMRELGGSCVDNNCPIYAGGLSRSCDKARTPELPIRTYPQDVTCENGRCMCDNDRCPLFGLCLRQGDNDVVRYGIAKGVAEWQCPYYYCNIYDRVEDRWRPANTPEGHRACSAICLPELYNNYNRIPETIRTTKGQIDFLLDSGLRQAEPNSEVCKPSGDTTCNIL